MIVGSIFLALWNHRNGNGFAHLEGDSRNHLVRLVVISSRVGGGEPELSSEISHVLAGPIIAVR